MSIHVQLIWYYKNKIMTVKLFLSNIQIQPRKGAFPPKGTLLYVFHLEQFTLEDLFIEVSTVQHKKHETFSFSYFDMISWQI